MKYSYVSLLALLLTSAVTVGPAIADVVQDNSTLTNVSSAVNPVNALGRQFNITGTQVSGNNQFHSFSQFNLKSSDIAEFSPALGVTNILSRVTSGKASEIDGLIRSSTSNVNLFFMNPAGILFGNNARLDVQGVFSATTANAIGGFNDNKWFSATDNNFAGLTGIPNQFAFTGSNPGTIINSGDLSTPNLQALNLIGGTVINTGKLADQGDITIVAVEGGKAVKIGDPSGLLTYTLPIDPTIGNPVSLPELLTSPFASNISGVEIKNGEIVLANSTTPLKTPLSERSGLIISSKDINTAGVVMINGSTIKLANVSGSSSESDLAISLTAENDIQVGDLQAGTLSGARAGVIEVLSAQGNIKAGIIQSENLLPTQLIARKGNIEVIGIQAGPFGETDEVVLNIFAGGTFRAIGVIDNEYSYSLRNTNQQVLEFLSNKTGKTVAELQALLEFSDARLYVPAPTSILLTRGNAKIAYAGGGGSINTLFPESTIQGGNARFEVGSKRIPNNGDPYILKDPTKTLNDFLTTPNFDTSWVENVTYQKTSLAPNISGTVGAIVRNKKLDGTLSIGLQDQAFGVLPEPKPEPKPDPNHNSSKVPTIDLETRNQNALALCPDKKTIALTPTEQTRSTDSTVSSKPQPKDPCKPDDNEEELLKILK